MRVTDRMLTQNYISYLSNNKAKAEDLKDKIASGQNIRKPSDSPVGMANVVNLQYTLNINKSYITNIKNSTAFVESTMNSMEAILSEVEKVDLKLAQIGDSSKKEFLENFGQQVNDSLVSILELSNTEFQGKYIFGGTDYSTKTYEFNADKSAVEQLIPDTSGKQNVKIRNNSTMQINISGGEVFGDIDGNDIFNTLINIKNSLNNGEMPDQSMVDNVKNFHKTFLDKISKVGNNLNRLEDTKNQLEGQDLVVQDLISQENEVDMAKAIMQLQGYDYMLETSYRLSSLINRRSLMDYL